MPQFLESAAEKPRIRLSKVDGAWKATVEYARHVNPYKLAVGLSLPDVPTVVAQQYGNYPNPHLFASIMVCEQALGLSRQFPKSVGYQRNQALYAVLIRDTALHLATCFRSDDLGDSGVDLVSLALSIAKTARELEAVLAGSIDQPRIFFGGVVAPERFRVEQLTKKFEEYRVFWEEARLTVLHALPAVLAHERKNFYDITKLGRWMSFMTAPVPDYVYESYRQDAFGPVQHEQVELWIRAPRGSLQHALNCNPENQSVIEGSVTVPTEHNMVDLERGCLTLLNRMLNPVVDRSQIESVLVRLARAYNPCGLDLSGDFIDIIWED